MKKRILSILLTLCMVLCIVPIGVFAEDCAEDLVDPVIRIIPYGDRGYSTQSGTLTAADFFRPGKAPANAKITAITAPASPSILDSISVDGDGKLSYEKKEERGTKLKTDTYTVTITGDDCAPVSAPLTVRQYLYADFKTTYDVSPWVYGDTRTWTWQVTNPGENGVWSAHMREEGIFEIYEETVDTTSEPGKSFYTIKYRAIKAGTTFIDILYVSDTTASWSPWSGSNVVAGGPVFTRTLTVTARDATISTGDTLPTDLVSCAGLLDSEGRTDDRDTVLENALSYRLLDANNEEVTAETARNTPGTYTVVPAAALKSGWDERYSLNRVNGTLTVEKRVDEQFTLTPGGRYYFDLSAMNIPGTVNSNLPDSTLHYVPFTYVGTVDAYKRTGVSDKNTDAYEHSLFIADYAVTHTVSWNDLNAQGMIFGKTYTSGSIDYTLRAPSVGQYDTSRPPAIRNNEWDTILAKANQQEQGNNGYIKNWQDMYSLGQEMWQGVAGFSLSRGYNSTAGWSYTGASSAEVGYGYRPVLELPTDLAADSLKVVELITDGRMPGETYQSINIIVKNGEGFTAPSAEGLPLSANTAADTPMWWVDENLNFYKPGDTVPASVSKLTAFYGGFGLLLDRGDGAVEVTPDNYTDIFGDGTASFVVPKGESLESIAESGGLTATEQREILTTGRLGENIFPNLQLKNADLTSVTLNDRYIGQNSPLFITLDGKNTIGSLNEINRASFLSILGDGALTLNNALTLSQYAQYGGSSVTMAGGLNVYNISVGSGSLTVTGDTQAITFQDQYISDLYMGDGVRLFLGSSAQDAVEAAIPQLSAEMQEVFQRYQADDPTLTREEYSALSKALKEQFDAILPLFSGKTYVRIANAWDVTYQPGTNGTGDIATDVKFYGDALTLRGKLFTRIGYTQTGWATVDGGEKIYGLDAVYTQNEALTLYPVWNANQYTITFDTAGGSKIDSITQDYGTTITAPANPTREGYTFIGWNRKIPETMPAENITITAQWKDSEKPTGEISIGENKWKTLLNNITFGLFFKDTQTVTITAADNSGEAVTVEYLLSAKELTETELASAAFTAYTAPFGIDPDNEYIIYVRLTDKADNVSYICSDGIVLDSKNPVIKGIENGKIFCEAQTVTIDEKYIDTVTVNGTPVTLDENNSFVLSPADGEQKIVVTDKSGNTAEMTVTVNDGHTFGEWASNGDGTHTHKCTVDGCDGFETKDCSGGKATCTEKAVCEVCGKAYGELDANNHADLKHIDAKAATKDAEGNIEYWYCEECGKYYSDADATKEITKAATVTAKLPDEPKSPQTGDNSNLMLWVALLFISGGVATGTTVVSKKKKHSAK